MNNTPSRWRKRLLFILVLVLLVGGAGGAAYLLNLPIPGFTAKPSPAPSAEPDRPKVALVKDKSGTVSISNEVLASLGIRKNGKNIVAIAEPPKSKRPLVLSASTAFDPGSVYPIRARFAPAKVIEISSIADVGGGSTKYHELRSGDPVKADAPIAVFYSTDVAQKKNDLIDALVQYKLDKQLLDNTKPNIGAIPEVLRLNYVKNVQSDINAIDRALKMLQLWEIPAEDIEAVYAEAKRRAEAGDMRDFEKYDAPKKEDKNKEEKWGKVVVKAPADGAIVERNLSLNVLVVDPTVNLFQIAKADELLVLANAPEETVKELSEAMQKSPLKWTIHTLGDPDGRGFPGAVHEIGMIVDPNQHTVPIKGLLVNKDRVLRAGQYVTATIELPPPADTVEIPASAIADDGKQAIVFVQLDGGKSEYEMRRVMITGRVEDRVFVRSRLLEKETALTPEEKEQGLLPKMPLERGERVITSGLLELKKELEDLESAKAE